MAGIPAEQPSQDDPIVHSPPGLSSPLHLYQSPFPPVDEEVSKYDVESEWMDSESEKEMDQSPSPCVLSSSSSAFRPVQPQPVYATGPATSSVSPPVSRVEGQPSCDGQVLHTPLGKRIEGHSHCDRELDLRDHPHPQKYARSVTPSVATFEFTDVRSREPYICLIVCPRWCDCDAQMSPRTMSVYHVNPSLYLLFAPRHVPLIRGAMRMLYASPPSLCPPQQVPR